MASSRSSLSNNRWKWCCCSVNRFVSVPVWGFSGGNHIVPDKLMTSFFETRGVRFRNLALIIGSLIQSERREKYPYDILRLAVDGWWVVGRTRQRTKDN